MSAVKLSSHNFRNLSNSSIELDADLNFFVGDNGSGKSSLLEAIFFVAHGKSFRTTKVDNIVCYDNERCAVSIVDDNNFQLGLSRDSSLGITRIKMNGEKQTKLSAIAQRIAVQIVTPESFKLFFGGPKERRRFIDLGMFHVKHEFSQQWRDFSRVLKQRNACIRGRADNKTLQYWTDQFVTLSETVSNHRKLYVDGLITELDCWLEYLLPDLSKQVSVQYHAGWSDKKQLADILASTSAKEREANYGFSMYGAQKFDVKFLLHQQPIESQLSRGQQKLFLLALTFAQTKLIEQVNRIKPILLIDDIGAELDNNSRQLLALSLNKINCQFLITAIDEFVLKPLVSINGKHKMFHVKHGEVLEINTKSE